MAKEQLSDIHLAAWRAFLKVHATVVDRIDHDLVADHRVPLSSYDVLIELYEAPERRLRMHELAQSRVKPQWPDAAGGSIRGRRFANARSLWDGSSWSVCGDY